MKKTCSACGNSIGKDETFCSKCGAAANPDHSETVTSSSQTKRGTFGNYIKAIIVEIKKLLKNPKVLFKMILPSLIIAFVWTVLAFLEMAYPKNAIIRVFSFFTFAQGGMFGGFVGALGGIVGKAVFAYLLCTVVNAIINKRKINTKEIFAGFKISGLSALGYFLIGAGDAILLYLLMNITSSAQNAMIGVVGAVMIVTAAEKKSGLHLMAICELAKLMTHGKAPSQMTVSRVLSGMATGFVVAVPLSMFRSVWICPVVCLLLLTAGVLTLVFGGKNKAAKSVAGAIAFFMLVSPLLTLTIYAADYKAGDWLTVDEFYEYYDLNTYSTLYDVGTRINERVEASDKGLYPSEFEVKIYDVENQAGYYAQRCAEDAYVSGNCSYDKTADSNIGKTYILGKEPIDISFSGADSGYGKGPYEHNYHINIKDLTFKFGAMIVNLGSPFKVTYTADGSAYGSGSYNSEDGETTYSEIHSAKFDYPKEEQDTLYCYFPENGLMILKLSVRSSSDEYFDDGELCTGGVSFVVRFAVTRVKLDKEPESGGLWSLLFGNNDELDPDSSGWIISDDPSDNEGYQEPTGDGNETRKGVPLKDYDRDGDIDYNDRVIQYNLIHDPDHLTRNSPAGASVAAILSILAGLLGGAAAGAAGGMAGAAGGAAAGSVGLASPYIKFDAAGDIEWTDPVTGKMTQYVKQKNGQYKNPLTDQSYTYDELYENAAYRERNAEGFAQDAETAERNVEEQRAESGGLSDNAKEHAEFLRELEMIAKDRKKMIDMANKYHLPDDMEKDDFIEAVLRKMDAERARGNQYAAQGNRMEFYEKSAETVVTAADMSMDALSNLTGPVGKGINASYKVAKGAAGKGAEEYNKPDGDVASGILQGTIEGGIDAATDFLGGKTKAAATVAGETAKGGIDAYMDGKDVTEGMVEGAKKGAVNAAIDLGAEKIGDKIKKANMPGGGNDSELVKHINESDDATAKKVVAGIKDFSDKVDAGASVPDNIAKKAAENAMKKDNE